MDLNAQLKRAIRDHMYNSDIKQVQLAKDLRMSPAALNHVLTGDRGLLTTNAVAVLDALDLELVVQLRSKPDG